MLGEAIGLAFIGAQAGVRYLRRRRGAGALALGPSEEAGPDELVAPAYPRLVAAAPTVRAALLEVAAQLQLDPAALATIIESESDWDPTAPHQQTGTPRGGLIQITQGARLPGLDTAERVWALRGWPAERQLRELVGPFFVRFNGRNRGWTALDVYKRTFLPADVSRAMDFKLGEKDSTELVVPNHKLTRGQVFAANPGFDRHKRGYFTWTDVAERIADVEGRARGQWVTVAGRRVPAPTAAPPAASGGAQRQTAAPARGAASSSGGAPALLALRRQVDERWPSRSKASDGLWGDASHQARKSDHNEGNALDITHDPVHGPALDALAEELLADNRVAYVIWNRRIASRTMQAGVWRPYTGTSPHTRHIHVSIVPERRNDARPWRLPDASPGVGAVVALPGLVTAWRAGLVDNVHPVDLVVAGYRLKVAADALSVYGVRVPTSFRGVLGVCKGGPLLMNTKRIATARWDAAQRKVVAPLGVTGDAELHARYPTAESLARAFSASIGPLSTGQIVAGAWADWLLEDFALESQVTARSGGGAQSHYSRLFAPVFRRAVAPDGRDVDLVDELAKGCALGGPLPGWLVEALR